MKNSIKAKILSFAIISTIVMNIGTITVSASTDEKMKSYAMAQEMEEAIAILDSYIEVEKNDDINVLTLDVPENVKSSIDSEILKTLSLNIDAVNEESTAQNVIISDNGTIYEDTDEYVLQGGNIDKFEEYWWGFKRWASRDAAWDLQDVCSKISNGCWGAATFGGVITLTPASPVGVEIGRAHV